MYQISSVSSLFTKRNQQRFLNSNTSVVPRKVEQHTCSTMRSTARRNVVITTALSVALVQFLLLTSEAFKQVVPSIPKTIVAASGRVVHPILSLRGGDYYDDSSSTLDVEVDLDEIESSDEEEEEEEEVVQEKLSPKLAQAVQAASSKVKAKAVKAATQSAKAAIESTLLTNNPKAKKEKSGLVKLFQLPYIVKACLNPFIFFQMTKEYWLSLFNHKYGEKAKV
jgi:hypothetical protein